MFVLSLRDSGILSTFPSNDLLGYLNCARLAGWCSVLVRAVAVTTPVQPPISSSVDLSSCHVSRASGDSLEESFAEDHQLLARGQRDAAREHIVIEARNFFEEAAIDRNQNP